jgi:uncharacterized protein (TIGR02246 family)
MRCAAAILGAAALVVSPAFALGDDPIPKPAVSGAETNSKAQSADERTIRAAAEAFARAYNAGDAHALAEQFSQDADVVDIDGVRTRGREAIEQVLAATFKDEPGVRIALTIDSLRFLSPDVALEEGRNRVTPAGGGAPLARRHLVIHVKQDGRWSMDSVREEKEPAIRPHDRLKDLEWMLGEWTDEGADSIVRTSCHWSTDENYLLRAIAVQVHGATATNITQRIGWDPLTRQIKSWEFDSEGGYSEGLWSRDGTGWVVKHNGVLPDGRTASATRLIALERPNRVRWASIDRVAGGEAIPDELSYIMVKVPPAPGTQAGAGETKAPSSTPAPAKEKR